MEDDKKILHFDASGSELDRNGKPAPKPLKVNTFADLAGMEVAPMRFLVEELVPECAVTGLYGRGSIGKTMLCLQLAEAVATGADFMGLTTEQGTVLAMLNEDDTDEINRRIRRFQGSSANAQVIEFADVDDPCLMRFDGRTGAPLSTDTARRLVATIAELKPLLVILDPIGFIYGGNENDRQAVSAFVRWFSNLCARYRCAIILVGHPAKSNESEYSGSTAWDGSVRSRLLLKKDEDGGDDEYRLMRPKSNYAPRDDEGLHMVQTIDGTFVSASLFDLKDKKAKDRIKRREDADALVLNFCREQYEKQGQMPTRSTGQSSAYSLINALCPERLATDKFTAGELANSVTRLANDGKLVAEEYKTPSRHTSTRLVPAELRKCINE